MNLDEFIVPTSIESPTASALSPFSVEAAGSSTVAASAIPIQKRQQLQGDIHVARASAPSVAPMAHSAQQEFGYVPRHVRKTSIDERRVRSGHTKSAAPGDTDHCDSHLSGEQKRRRKSPLRPHITWAKI